MQYYFHLGRIAAMVAFIAALEGCGPSGATVMGTVTYEGKAVEFGNVVFTVGEKHVDARIQPDGTYQAIGVPFGEAKIAVHSARQRSEKPEDLPRPPEAKRKKLQPKVAQKGVVLPEMYNDAAKSGLVLTVNQALMTHDIPLKKQE